MPKRSESLLEKLKLGQQGWNEVLARNAQRLNDILLKVDGLLDVEISGLKDGDVLWWNQSAGKFQNVNKAYAVSAGSVSSASSESIISSVSSISSESSYSSNESPSSSSSNEANCSDWGADLTTGETATASDDYNSPSWAIDGDTTHGWASDEILPEWWKVQLTTPANIERLRIFPYVNVDQHPTAFTFQGSNSGEFTGEQDTLLTVSGYTFTSGVWGDWEFINGQNYRYYRIYITATNDANYTRLNEIQMYQCDNRSGSSSSQSSESESSSSESSLFCDGDKFDVYTADLTGGETFDGDSYYTGYPPSKAFDGLYSDISHCWLIENPTWPHWIEVEFAVAKTIRRLRICAYHDGSQAPENFTFKASNTGAFSGEETTLLTVTNNTWTGLYNFKTWDFANITAYKYYRVITTSNDSTAWFSIAEIEMMEFGGESCSSSSSSSESSVSIP